MKQNTSEREGEPQPPNFNISNAVKNLIYETAFSGFQEESFLVCHVDLLKEQFSKWQTMFDFASPTFEMKNANRYVIQTLSDFGCHFICLNKDEMRTALDVGVPAEQIRFHHEMLVAGHLKFAHSNGIHSIVFRTEADLKKIKKYAPNARLILDLRAQSNDGEILHLLQSAKLTQMTVFGISFRGRKMENETSKAETTSTIKAMREKIDSTLQYGRQLGHFPRNKTLLDLGHFEVNEVVAEELREAMVDFDSESKTTICTGDYIVSNTFTLAVKILNKQCFMDQKSRPCFSYIINDGIFGSFGHILTSEDGAVELRPKPLMGNENDEKLRTDILGPSGDDLDVVGTNLDMAEMEMGDWMLFPDAGRFSIKDYESFVTSKESDFDPELRLFYKPIESQISSLANFDQDQISYTFEDLLPEMMYS